MGSKSSPEFLRRRFRVEPLEPRLLLAGDTFLINFQLVGTPVPTRYLADTGAVFGDRGNGLSYGWSSDHTDQSRDRNLVADQRLDTLIHFEVGQKWEFQLPNGVYEATVSIGDAQFASTHTLNVEGVNFWNALALTPGDFRVQSQQITVADGQLTLNQGAAGDKATRINYIHIVGLPSTVNSMPSSPTITEPAVNGQIVNPGDVHMEAIGYSDPDGNAHKSTDWSIWTVGAGAEPVWQTLGITGVERLHTHLGDGIYINSHAGRTDLLPNTDYELRVRFRDDAGSVSAYATRTLHTGAASATFPLELEDVASLPSQYWVNSLGQNVVLPADSSTQLRLTSPSGEQLLTVSGFNGITNSVSNPAALADHAEVRIVVVAGSIALNLGATDLLITDDQGASHTIYLPSIVLAAGQRLDLWVAADGSTYYGTQAQTAPDFSNLARPSNAAIANPFTAIQANFVVEVVAGGFQLPVNIAFVPNPGPNANDPLFYVTELYGTIKLVTRNFSVGTYASGLLNFNPTGNFPGTGEQGLAGIVVDPLSGDLFVTRVNSSSSDPDDDSAPHYPQVVRLSSSDGGHTASSVTVIRDMVGESQGQSHQISNITIGPDGKLYVHVGDGFDYTTAQNLDSYRGKVLRMNLDGAAPSDNPFYNAANGINARDYVFAYGVRNPFGGAWRSSDGKHYEVENGPSVDRLAQINRGFNYGWNNSDASMSINAIYNWNPAHAPVNIAFTQSSVFAGSQFPSGKLDHAFVSESGPTYATGPQVRGKRIVEFTIAANGTLAGGPTTLVEYTGTGQGTVVALAAGPDGLYFSELYKDLGAVTPIDAGARIFRVRYNNPIVGDYNINGVVDDADRIAWRASFGSNLLLGADGDHSGVVDASDYVVWRKSMAAGSATASAVDLDPSPNVIGQLTEPSPSGRGQGEGALDPSRSLAFASFASSPRNRAELTATHQAPLSPKSRRVSVGAHDAALLALLADRESDATPAESSTGSSEGRTENNCADRKLNASPLRSAGASLAGRQRILGPQIRALATRKLPSL